MFLAKSLFLSCLVLGVQLHLHQPQRFLVVEVGGTAEIHCSSSKDVDGGAKLHWYLRRAGEAPMHRKDCADDTKGPKFACKHQKYGTTLEIWDMQRKESGIYYCAHATTSSLTFGKGTTVIVGDSFTKDSSVLLLGPVAGENGATDPAHLACVIRGVSNLVQVSWGAPGEEPTQGLPHSLEASAGSLTLIHHISIPWASWASGTTVTCEVTFNSSGSSVTRHAVYSAPPRSGCRQEAMHYMVVGLLVLLMVSLTSLWMCVCSSPAFAASCCPGMICARPAPQCDCKGELCPRSRDPEQEILNSGARRSEVSYHETQAVRLG
ncbi:immunoglobulin alpha-2 heavy chain-like [Alligator sinensis]|uniref:immunoglobulin alpha-2 heavy chain-like n=1 Tax=Alligator sinensis TaxID=38654 RepID=UPI000D72015E|nr:immunoglobulin alpha-2 heavy chain-like [Alligator sinensis]